MPKANANKSETQKKPSAAKKLQLKKHLKQLEKQAEHDPRKLNFFLHEEIAQIKKQLEA